MAKVTDLHPYINANKNHYQYKNTKIPLPLL
jgi:hypothetical protein